MPEAIIPILSVVGGVIGALITGAIQRRKTNAEAEKAQSEADKGCADANEVIRQTVMALIQPLRIRIEELEREVNILKCENTDLRTWAEALVNQIKEMGKEPIPFRVKRERNA